MKNVFSKINNRMSNAKTLIRHFPIVLKEAKGCWVTDMNNKQYLDCISSAGTLPMGHNHEVLKQTLKEFETKDYPTQTMDIPTELQDKFLDTLYDFVPKSFSKNAKIQVCSPSGADATEASIKLCKIATGRNSIISFYGGYHGQTYGATSISGKVRSSLPYPGMNDVNFLPYPFPYRCPYNIGKEGYKTSLYQIEHILSNPECGISKPAAVILEAIQGEGGVIPANIEWLQGVRELTTKHDIPLIMDEVQTGFCRTGKKFAFEEADIIPDVICLAKAIGGSLPLSAIMLNKDLDIWKEYQHAGTWRGNQLSYLSAINCINFMNENLLWEKVEINGDYLKSELVKLKEDFTFIGEIRGRGLMLALEIVDVKKSINELGSYPPDSNIAQIIQSQSLENGLLLLRGGAKKNVIRIMPPLIISKDEIDILLNIIKNIFIKINN